ncbi:hypothetical protein EV356DRAFT_529060 [Viridothelium virens]|uniref:Uncharacterized protein n=1 Tax=Viridothelium virens TaxID=1048519 RepID=A0A6A6HKD6_VIRVR|nr:hypothetical protein EV356DRAFT_529060 [Viridothelium virens]
MGNYACRSENREAELKGGAQAVSQRLRSTVKWIEAARWLRVGIGHSLGVAELLHRLRHLESSSGTRKRVWRNGQVALPVSSKGSAQSMWSKGIIPPVPFVPLSIWMSRDDDGIGEPILDQGGGLFRLAMDPATNAATLASCRPSGEGARHASRKPSIQD